MKLFTLIIAALACSTLARSEETPSPSPAGNLQVPVEHWVVKEDASPIDDSQTVTLRVLGKLDVASGYCSLVLRYKEHEWEAFFGTSEYIGTSRKPKVLLRWDSAPAETSTWESSVTGAGVFAPSAKKFILRAMKTSKLVVRLYAFTGEEQTAVFDLTGLTDELAKFPELQKTLAEKTKQ